MKPKYPKYAKEVHELLANLDNDQDNQETEPQTEIPAPDIQSLLDEEEPGVSYHVHHFTDALIIIKESGAKPDE